MTSWQKLKPQWLSPEHTRGERQRRSRRQRENKLSLRNWIVAAAVTIVLFGTVALVTRDSDALAGEIVAEYTEYDFGEVEFDGGIISTQFPLRALDPAQITKIQTT